jgi:type I restriction-modification system DNA methylase subunit
MRKSELSSAIKTARDIMRKDAGLSTDVDRIPQLSWILFLKCFDDLEQRRMLLEGKYRDVIEAPYRWRDWAADEDRGRTGDELLDFVNSDLFPYLRGLVGTEEGDQRDGPTKEIWYYELPLPEGRKQYTKTKRTPAARRRWCTARQRNWLRLFWKRNVRFWR